MAHRGDHLRQRRSVLNMDEVTLNSWNSIAPTTRTAGQGGTAVTRFWGKLPMLAAALVITIAYTYAADTPLLEPRSEEHTSELQSRGHLVCRLLLEKKKKNK